MSEHETSGTKAQVQSDSTIEFSVDTDPSPEEAIALTIAIARFQAEQTTEEHETEHWSPDRWSLHGRFANLGTPVDKLPYELPRDPWRSHARVDLY
jgi:hypothetical protein